MATNASALKARLQETPWEFVERKSGGFAVQLETGAADFTQALCRLRPDGTVDLGVDLLELPADMAPECRAATTQLLLMAGNVVRLVRGAVVAQPDAASRSARLEVSFAAVPCAASLAQALEALSVACRICGDEVRLLGRSPALAASYLEQFRIP